MCRIPFLVSTFPTFFLRIFRRILTLQFRRKGEVQRWKDPVIIVLAVVYITRNMAFLVSVIALYVPIDNTNDQTQLYNTYNYINLFEATELFPLCGAGIVYAVEILTYFKRYNVSGNLPIVRVTKKNNFI
jgi:hypothetical protein